jgi:hypothetical protein
VEWRRFMILPMKDEKINEHLFLVQFQERPLYISYDFNDLQPGKMNMPPKIRNGIKDWFINWDPLRDYCPEPTDASQKFFLHYSAWENVGSLTQI